MNFYHPNIQILGHRDAGAVDITYFTIDSSDKQSAATYLIELLDGAIEFYLCNDNDDGATQFRLHDGNLESLSGGHGRMGDWRISRREDMIKKILMLSQFNTGNDLSRCGGIEVRKTPK